MDIVGHTVKLIPAQESDRKRIYNWLCKSDLTSAMMGPPVCPEHPTPTWKEFREEYPLPFFDASGDGKGRVFMIIAGGEEVGTIGYDLLDCKKDRAVLDIWMKAENCCGHGYGSDALHTLSVHIHEIYGIINFSIFPPGKNKRALAAYRKAGFENLRSLSKKEQEKEFGKAEYDDTIFMLKTFIKTRFT